MNKQQDFLKRIIEKLQAVAVLGRLMTEVQKLQT
jgi:hypothetical protein